MVNFSLWGSGDGRGRRLDAPQTYDTNNLHLNKPRKRLKPSLLLREKVANARIKKKYHLQVNEAFDG